MALPMTGPSLALWLAGMMVTNDGGTAQPPANKPTTLVLMSVGEGRDRSTLQPVINALCYKFKNEPGEYSDVIKLDPSKNIAAALQDLTPKDIRDDKGAILRHIHGGIKARAFTSCLNDATPESLPEPVEVALISISDRIPESISVSAAQYRLDHGSVSSAGKVFDAQGRKFQLASEVSALAACVARRFWNRDWIDDAQCATMEPLIGSIDVRPQPVPAPPPPPPPAPPPARPIWKRWWVWTVAGAVVAGSVAALAARGGGGQDYPECPIGAHCPR